MARQIDYLVWQKRLLREQASLGRRSAMYLKWTLIHRFDRGNPLVSQSARLVWESFYRLQRIERRCEAAFQQAERELANG